MRTAGDLVPSFPGRAVYTARDNSILLVVVAKVSTMRTAGLLAEDAAVANVKERVEHRKLLSPLTMFGEYNALDNFRNALSDEPSTGIIYCLGGADDYCVYANSRGRTLPVVMPSTASVIARLEAKEMHIQEL